jgi:hypothetical protein
LLNDCDYLQQVESVVVESTTVESTKVVSVVVEVVSTELPPHETKVIVAMKAIANITFFIVLIV